MSRLTPLRTSTLTPAPPKNAQHFLGWSCDQPIEFAPHVCLGHGDVPPRSLVAQKDETELAAAHLLVALHRLPGAFAVDPGGPRSQQLFYDARVAAGEAERGEEAECNGTPMRELF